MIDDAVMEVPDDQWLSIGQASSELGLPVWRLRILMRHGHLLRVRNSNGDIGVARESLTAEARWRADASLARRAGRLVNDALSWGP